MEISCTLGSTSRIVDSDYSYYLFHKPYGVLSQFTREVPHHVTLADFLDLPKDIYPVGRLDKDSEGLLLLTNDNTFKTKLLNPKSRSYKTYHVQVDGCISTAAITELQDGVFIKVGKSIHKTAPSIVIQLTTVEHPDRDPPVRYRADIPTSWLSISIYEGKNRQVRKMCAKVGFPCLRLIRVKIGNLQKQLKVGESVQLTSEDIVNI